MAINEAPEHSARHWQFLVEARIARPTPEELRSLHSLDQWLEAVRRYSAPRNAECGMRNAERRARGETEIHAVYAVAGHELRPWLAAAGTPGLLAFIDWLNAGVSFESAYRPAPSSLQRTDARGAR